MTIASLADLRAAARQRVTVTKGAVGSQLLTFSPCSWWALGGTPGAGNWGLSVTASGIVPTVTTTGAFPIVPFSGVGYLKRVEAQIDVGNFGRVYLWDMLFQCGSYAVNTSTTLSSPPSYSSRVPGGDYTGLQLWAEMNSGNSTRSVTVTYTDQSGNAGHSTGAVTLANAGNVPNNMQQLPLQAGDTGVQQIESVTMANVGAGSTNIMVMRQLWSGPAQSIISTLLHDWGETGLPRVFTDSCLTAALNGIANSSTLPDLFMDLDIVSR